MSKEKGPKKFEDGRQKIDVDYNEDAHSAQRTKKKMSSSILTPVFLLFICIPIAFIVYFWKFYDPSSVGEQAKIEDNQVVEVTKDSVSTPPKNSGAAVTTDDEPEKTLSDEEKAAAALAAQEAAEKAAKAEADRVAQKAAEEKAAAEAAAEEERRKAEEEEARQQAAIAAEQARQQAAAEEARKQAEAKEQQKQQEQQQAVRYHTVQPNETLYRISVNYYGSGDAVDRIKAANGLASNEISVGQSLKLP